MPIIGELCILLKMAMEVAGTIGSEQGVVDGHAYAVIQIKEVEGFQLLQIRNPWGGGDKFERLQEASGRGKWDAYPAVKSLVASSSSRGDGLLWVAWEDFDRLFSRITICRRGVPIEFDKEARHRRAVLAFKRQAKRRRRPPAGRS